MSWQTYVDSNLVGSGNFISAAIMGHDGSLWARTAHFVDSSESSNMLKHIKAFDTSDMKLEGKVCKF